MQARFVHASESIPSRSKPQLCKDTRLMELIHWLRLLCPLTNDDIARDRGKKLVKIAMDASKKAGGKAAAQKPPLTLLDLLFILRHL